MMCSCAAGPAGPPRPTWAVDRRSTVDESFLISATGLADFVDPRGAVTYAGEPPAHRGEGVEEVPEDDGVEGLWERLPSSRFASLSHARRRQRMGTDHHHMLSQSNDEVDSVHTGANRALSRSLSERARRAVHFDVPLRRTSSLPRHLTPTEITIFDDLRNEDTEKSSTLPLKTRMQYRLVGGVSLCGQAPHARSSVHTGTQTSFSAPATVWWCALCVGGVPYVLVVCPMCWWCALCVGGAPYVLVVCPMCWWCALCVGGVPYVLVVRPMCWWCALCVGGVPYVLVVCPMCWWCALCVGGAPSVSAPQLVCGGWHC